MRSLFPIALVSFSFIPFSGCSLLALKPGTQIDDAPSYERRDSTPRTLPPGFTEQDLGIRASGRRAPARARVEAKGEDEAEPQDADEDETEAAETPVFTFDPGELVLGMDMNEVRDAWGTPREVQTAGDPRLGNQKWVYVTGLSSRWSVSTARVVYFEDGRVVGWDTVQR